MANLDKDSKEYESLQAKLKKLLALAERGVAGEAENARRLLEKLCEQHGISMEELLDDNQTREYVIEIGRGKHCIMLFSHCLAQVRSIKGVRYYQPTRSSISIELTAMEYAAVLDMFNWHKANYEQELEEYVQDFKSAYIHKHNLYIRHDDEEQDEERKPLTAEQRARLMRIIAMTDTMSNKTYRKQLEAKQ